MKSVIARSQCFFMKPSKSGWPRHKCKSNSVMWRKITLICFALFAASHAALRGLIDESDAIVETRAWQTSADLKSWPEDDVASINSKDSVGIVFNGGGSRAYSGSLGYLAGLHKHGLLKNVKYMTGVSGGTWAVGSFTFTPIDSDTFLGPVTPPVEITMDFLSKKVSEKCARTAFAEQNFVALMAKKLFTNGLDFSAAWVDSVEEIVSNPSDIDGSKVPAMSMEAVHQYAQDFPSLMESVTFITHDMESKPFPIMGITLVAPEDKEPRPGNKDVFTLIEATPMYIGVNTQKQVEFPIMKPSPLCFWCTKTELLDIGGFVEPFAFGTAAPSAGLAGASSGKLSVARDDSKAAFAFKHVLGASSYVAGSVFSSLPVFRLFDFKVNYWSPSTAQPRDISMSVGDGGSVMNIPIISLLRRRVKKVVVFTSDYAPLPTREQWDPRTSPMDNDQVDQSIAALFGIIKPVGILGAWDESRNNVFPTSDFVPLVMALQDAQATGDGAVVTMDHVTIKNDWWDIPGGQAVSVTWVLSSRMANWENDLPAEVREHLQDGKVDGTHCRVASGPFKGFPFFSTFDIHPTRSQMNLMSEFTGAIVDKNVEKLRKALSTGSMESVVQVGNPMPNMPAMAQA